jgi:hypothetical protein
MYKVTMVYQDLRSTALQMFPRIVEGSQSTRGVTLISNLLRCKAVSIRLAGGLELHYGVTKKYSILPSVNLLELSFSPEAIVATVSELQRRRRR